MRYLTKILAVILFFILNTITLEAKAQDVISTDSISEMVDQIIEGIHHSEVDTLVVEKPARVYNYVLLKPTKSTSEKIEFVDTYTFKHRVDSLMKLPKTYQDSLLMHSSSLYLPLIYRPRPYEAVWDGENNFVELFHGKKQNALKVFDFDLNTKESIILDLRKQARNHISNNALDLYVTTIDRLPNLSSFMSRRIQGKEVSALEVHDNKIDLGKPKIELGDIGKMYWIKKANAMLQFSQNHVSSNWHQGGNSNLAFLSILNGELNYDNQKNVVWENRLEWRIGFNKIQSEKALRNLNINDDILRYNTKFGVKAGGNWYYSVSGEAATQLFDNYRAFDSEVFKARIFTPVRVNIGVGMDYKYKKSFSLMIAPVAFKYIYLQDTTTVNPNLFGLKKGENQLKQLGSSLRAQSNLKPSNNWNIDSRLTFYTDYKKVEIDLEVVNNFVINRFLTTRLLINPRFDNTIILKEGEKSKIQFKELLSIGFSYRFI